MNSVFLSIGSNLGNREQNLQQSISMLSKLDETLIILESSIYETEPLYNMNQTYFFNKVIKIQTKLNPYELLEKVKTIESIMGRDLNGSHNLPRIIDIDILVFDDLIIDSKKLILPHPRICERRFVLEPWGEITPSYKIVNEKLTIKELHNECLKNKKNSQEVKLINN